MFQDSFNTILMYSFHCSIFLNQHLFFILLLSCLSIIPEKETKAFFQDITKISQFFMDFESLLYIFCFLLFSSMIAKHRNEEYKEEILIQKYFNGISKSC